MLLQRTERSNATPESVLTLLAMRWMKPVHRRTPRQLTAHIIARFKMADTTNHTIQDRVVIAGKRVWVR